jgi:hypothetical protein
VPARYPNSPSRNRAGAVANQSIARQAKVECSRHATRATREQGSANFIGIILPLINRNAPDRHFDHTDVDLVGSRNAPDRPFFPLPPRRQHCHPRKAKRQGAASVAPLWAQARMRMGAKLLCAGSLFAMSPDWKEHLNRKASPQPPSPLDGCHFA